MVIKKPDYLHSAISDDTDMFLVDFEIEKQYPNQKKFIKRIIPGNRLTDDNTNPIKQLKE